MTHLVLLLFLLRSPLILFGDLSLLSDRVGEGEQLDPIVCLVWWRGTALDPDRGVGWIDWEPDALCWGPEAVGWEPEALTGVGNMGMS